VSEHKVIEAAKAGDRETLAHLLADGADIHEQDENGWTALNWAAGAGDAETVRLLLERGADVTRTGRDLRTPLAIAKAAGRKQVAEILTAREQELGVWEDPRLTQPYCKAYYLKQLREFPDWPSIAVEPGGDRPSTEGEDVAYVHQDFTVTESMWHGEDVIVGQVTPAWKEFCETRLQFAIPEDLL
jgi:hypothetical protein